METELSFSDLLRRTLSLIIEIILFTLSMWNGIHGDYGVATWMIGVAIWMHVVVQIPQHRNSTNGN